MIKITNDQIDNNREIIIDLLYKTDIKNIDDLINRLLLSDFFVAPASTKYHFAFPGGLALHSLNVMAAMEVLAFEFAEGNVSTTDITICGLLHDTCKVDYYRWDVDKGEYFVDDQLPLGHGEKSVYYINKFISLTAAQAAAIRWHMGAWTPGVIQDSRSFNVAVSKYPLVTILVNADNIAARLLEE